MSGIFLSPHINTKRLLTLVALLLELSKRGMMPDTMTELPLFFNDVGKSMIDFGNLTCCFFGTEIIRPCM